MPWERRWEFVIAINRTWTWRDQLGRVSPGAFDSLQAAMEHATLYGFDPSVAVHSVVHSSTKYGPYQAG